MGQVQYTYTSMSVRTSKLKNAPNNILIFFFSTNQSVFKKCPRMRARARVIARTARTERRNAVFRIDLTSDTYLSRFQNFQAISTKNDVIRKQ